MEAQDNAGGAVGSTELKTKPCESNSPRYRRLRPAGGTGEGGLLKCSTGHTSPKGKHATFLYPHRSDYDDATRDDWYGINGVTVINDSGRPESRRELRLRHWHGKYIPMGAPALRLHLTVMQGDQSPYANERAVNN